MRLAGTPLALLLGLLLLLPTATGTQADTSEWTAEEETLWFYQVRDVMTRNRCVFNNFPPTGAKQPMRVLVRNDSYSRRLVHFVGFILEYHNISVQPVYLNDVAQTGLGLYPVRNNLTDVDLLAPSYATPDSQAVELLGDHPVYGLWPGIYVSPELVNSLATGEATEPNQWFSYFRALGSQAFVLRVDTAYGGPLEACGIGVSGCYIPQICSNSFSPCRTIFVDPDILDGIDHIMTLVNNYQLPYMVKNLTSSQMEWVADNWHEPELGKMLVVTSRILGTLDPVFRIQFPYRRISARMSESPATKTHDWSNIRLWKVATLDFSVLLNQGARRVLARLDDFGEVYQRLDAMQDQTLHHVEQINQNPDVPDYFRSLGTNTSALEALVACQTATQYYTHLVQDTCGNGTNGTSNCSSTYCPSGSFFSIEESACRRCSIGYYCTASSDLQQPCPEGSTTVEEGARSTRDCFCKPGWGTTNSSVSGVPICRPCGKGVYKETVNNTVCAGVCPQHSSSDPGAIGITSCYCTASYYLQEVRQWTCAACPDGAVCSGGLRTDANVTSSRLESWPLHVAPRSLPGMYGFLLDTPTSEDGTFNPYFKKCPLRADCLGNNQCSPSTTGKQCRACKFNHMRDFNAGTGENKTGSGCMECSGVSLVLSERVSLTVIQPALLLVLLRMISYASRDSAVLTPVIVKLVGLFFLATETCITAILNERLFQGNDPVEQVANGLIAWIHQGAKMITTDFTVMDAYVCTFFSFLSEDAWTEEDLEKFMKAGYFLRMMEVVLAPVFWPCMALVAILPLGYLSRWFMGKKRTPDLENKLSTLERFQILILHGDISLPFAQVILEDTRVKLMQINSIAGVWRPFSVEAQARALAHEERPPGKKKLAFKGWFRNSVSMFMPFWFFHYLNVAENCMKAMISCNRQVDGDGYEWIHGSEPMLECFSGEHYIIGALGASGLVLYGLGFPILVIWVVYRKVKKDEEWCWNFNVNGYTFWGLITVYWDCMLLLRSSFLSLVSALPQTTFQREKRIGLMMICAIALHLQAHVQPFDARRNNLLNTVEMRSLYTSTLVAPLLLATVEMQDKGFLWGPRFCLVLFILLIIRFLWTVAVEISLEARDAAVQFKKQTAFAEMIRKKLEERQAARLLQQKEWLKTMLAGKSALAQSDGGRETEAASSVVEPQKTAVPVIGNPTRMMSGVLGYIKGLTASDECDEEENDRWSDFSEDVGGGMESHSQGFNILRCLSRIATRLEALIHYLGCSVLLHIVSLVNWLITKIYIISRRHEEMQNRYGVLYMEPEQSFKFVSGLGVMGGSNGLKQKEEMVAVFSSYFLCMLKLHKIRSLPIGLPRCFFRDVLHHAASDKRSLKWKAMTQKADKMLDTMVTAYISTRQDEEAYLGVNSLEVKMHRWLSIDNPSGRLVRVRQLETFLLHAQFMSHQMMSQNLLLASMDQAKPSLESRVVDYDNVMVVQDGEDDLHKRMRVGLSVAEASDEVLGHDMIVTDDVPNEYCSSHLDDYWDASRRIQVDRDLHPYVFWDPLQDPEHERAIQLEAKIKPSAHGYVVQTVPTSPDDSDLTLALNDYESHDSGSGHTPWPCHGNKGFRDLILNCKYLDSRMRHSLCRLPEPMAVDLLRKIAWQMDTLRSLRAGLASKVFDITKQVQDCRESALRCQKADKKFDGELTSAVLDTSEALVISVGMKTASELFQELNLRLTKSPILPTWHKTHAVWLEAATMERSREFSARWTRWGVPVTTSEESKMLHDFPSTRGCDKRQARLADRGQAAPRIRSIHSWPMWQMMLRRELNMNRARGGKGLLDENSANKGPAAIIESIMATPSGSVFRLAEWEALSDHFKGARGRPFAKILVMFLEERRQIILDWCFSVATNFLQEWPTQVTPMGIPYTYQIETYAQGHAIDSQFDMDIGDQEEMTRRRVDLDKCRRVFGLGDNMGANSGEIVWCSRGLHELAPLRDSDGLRDTTCDLCDSQLGITRTGQKYCCLLCNQVFCTGCTHLAQFLCAGMDDLMARHPVDPDAFHIRGALDVMEGRDPACLLDELKRLEGRLNCASGIQSSTEMSCREVAEWARQRILSGQSFLSMLLCTQGRHLFGFSTPTDGESHTCQICSKKLTNRSNECGECCNCETFFCKRCTEQVQSADFLRAEVTNLWKEAVLDDQTRCALLEQVKTRPVLVLDVLYMLINMKAEARKDADARVQNLTMVVHRALRLGGDSDEEEEEDDREGLDMIAVPKDDRPFKNAKVGPNENEGAKETVDVSNQCVLALNGMRANTVVPAPAERTPPAEIKELVDAYTKVAQKRDELQSAREAHGRRRMTGTGRAAPSGGDQAGSGGSGASASPAGSADCVS